jgi:hypothetical protein
MVSCTTCLNAVGESSFSPIPLPHLALALAFGFCVNKRKPESGNDFGPNLIRSQGLRFNQYMLQAQHNVDQSMTLPNQNLMLFQMVSLFYHF